MDTRIAVVNLWTEDVPTAVHFYRDVIGLNLLPHHGEQPHFDLDGSYLTILKGRPVPAQNVDPSRFPVIAFTVSDFDAAVERLLAHDVEPPWGVEQDALSRWVMFHDPAGNLIELVQFKDVLERNNEYPSSIAEMNRTGNAATAKTAQAGGS